MLKIYLIPDELAKPNSLKQANLECAGKISLEAFGELQQQGLIEKRFDYWTDFRWSSQQVKQKADIIFKNYPKSEKIKFDKIRSAEIFWTIIEKALSKNQGLIAYAD